MHPALVDVGDRQPGAFGPRKARDSAGDAAGALDREMEPGQCVLAECAADRGLDAEEHPERGMRPGVAPDLAARNREPGDEPGLLRDCDHVGDRHADVLGGDVIAGKPVDRAPERGDHLGSLGARGVGQDHRLATAERKPGHGILVAHPA